MAKFDLDTHKGKKTEVCLDDKISSWIPCLQKGTFTDSGGVAQKNRYRFHWRRPYNQHLISRGKQ